MDLIRRWRVRRHHPRRRLEVPGLPPFEMAVHRRFDRYISYAIHELGIWEPFETAVVQRLLAPGHTFVDVGANIGWYTMVAALRVGETGRVFSFEPDADNFAILRHNVRRNFRGRSRKNVVIERAAASDRNGAGRIFLSSDNMGDHRIYPSPGVAGSEKIREIRLDRYFRRFPGRLDLVKVDTQGAEPRVYEGARERLLRDRPILISEFWPFGMDASGRSAEEVLTFFGELDVDCFLIEDDERCLRPITLDQLAFRAQDDLRPETEAFVDLVVVPRADPRLEQIAEWVGEPWASESPSDPGRFPGQPRKPRT